MKGHARTIMTERVTAVTPETPVEAIARTLVAGRFGGVPVVEASGRVLGFVSEEDLLALLLANPSPSALASDVMTDPVLVDEFDTVEEVMRIMRERQADHLLVVREQRLVGIIAPLDVLRYFIDHVIPPPPEAS